MCCCPKLEQEEDRTLTIGAIRASTSKWYQLLSNFGRGKGIQLKFLKLMADSTRINTLRKGHMWARRR